MLNANVYDDLEDETIIKEEANEPKITEEEVFVISCSALIGITTPQIMEIHGYFKK